MCTWSKKEERRKFSAKNIFNIPTEKKGHLMSQLVPRLREPRKDNLIFFSSSEN